MITLIWLQDIALSDTTTAQFRLDAFFSQKNVELFHRKTWNGVKIYVFFSNKRMCVIRMII